MIRRFCDRDGQAITAEAFAMTWFDGHESLQSDLCASCQAELLVWFGRGNPEPDAVLIDARDLQSAVVLSDTVVKR